MTYDSWKTTEPDASMPRPNGCECHLAGRPIPRSPLIPPSEPCTPSEARHERPVLSDLRSGTC